MKKTYVTDKYSINIKEYELVRETEKQVWYSEPSWNGKSMVERRAHKTSEYFIHHPSLADAIQYLITRETERAEYHREQMIKHEKNASILIARQI